MTINEAAGEARELARETFWNGTGFVVVAFLVAVSVWERPGNDYLVYVALGIMTAHCLISIAAYNRDRRERVSRREVAVALREKLKSEQSLETHSDRTRHQPAAGRRREVAVVTQRGHLGVAVQARP